jgi:hypothetical protein
MADVELAEPVDCYPVISDFYYDDTTAHWISWSGRWRGVWFEDEGGFPLTGAEFWFYHHSSYPWDSSSFNCEVWMGDSSGPTELWVEEEHYAIHYQAVFFPVDFLWPMQDNFWIIQDTWPASLGGWPSVLGDDTPTTPPHSFHADEFCTWEPWTTDSGSCDLIIRASSIMWGLESSTWAGIKSLYI